MEIKFKFMSSFDHSANVIETEFRTQFLKKKIAGMKSAVFIERDAGGLGKFYDNLSIMLVVELCFFRRFILSPCH